MDQPLLEIRTEIPASPGELIPRPRLTDQLEKIAPSRRLVLITAPAGFGKTTLISQWARRSDYPFAWLSIDAGDDELDQFLRYLLAAWKRIEPAIESSSFGLIVGARDPDPPAALAAFINYANELEDHQFLVLDEYQRIESQAVHDSMAFLLDHLPPNLHLVIASRSEPPLPLARMRGRGQLLEFGPNQLQFSQKESARFLQDRMGLTLPEDVLVRWHRTLEGWVGGLQLAALGYRTGGSQQAQISPRQRHLVDFMSEEVLSQQSDFAQEFLLTTSVPDELCASLCDALTGQDNGREMLERLERDHLFIQPLDNERRWFRYHSLFHEFLRARLNDNHPELVADLHRRAAEWYQEQDLQRQAVEHAIRSGDSALTTEIADRYVPILINRGELASVRRLLDSMPGEWFDRHPMLALSRAAYFALTGDFESNQRQLAQVEKALEGEDSVRATRARGRLTAFRCATACMQNDLDGAESYGSLADKQLAKDDLFFREMIHLSMGDTYRQRGQWEQAQEHYQSALNIDGRSPMRFQSHHAHGALADLSLRRGKLQSAYRSWQQALAVSQERESFGAIPLPALGWVQIRMAEILYEWNRLDEAQDHLQQGMARAELGEDVRSMIAGRAVDTQLALAADNPDEAWSQLDEARKLLTNSPFPEWAARIDRLELELLMATGNRAEARTMAQQVLETMDRAKDADEVVLASCQVLVRSGGADDLMRASSTLKQLDQSAAAEGRMQIHLGALALRALAAEKAGRSAEALPALDQVLREAEPEGYRRLFLDLGRPFARLLQQADARGSLSAYGTELLAAFEDEPGIQTGAGAAQGLIEPLTDREAEVLELLAAGLTNKEIGEQLVIATGTVKKHTAHIYSKLNVSGRTEAAAVARELGLLD